MEWSGHGLISGTNWQLHEWNQQKYKKPHSGYLVSRPKFESGTSQIWRQDATHWTLMYGVMLVIILLPGVIVSKWIMTLIIQINPLIYISITEFKRCLKSNFFLEIIVLLTSCSVLWTHNKMTRYPLDK